jgi:DNA-binding transcriptional ArsR family regulator
MVAARFRVLGEPQRLRILHELQHGERTVTELVDALQTTQPNVSKHLKLLQESGIVGRRQVKNSAYYAIVDETVFRVCDIVCGQLEERLNQQVAAMTNARPAINRR